MGMLKILIAEDDALIALSMSDLLETMGHSICAIAETQDETVAAALLHHPDLMIVDAILRGGSGIAAVEEIAMTLVVPHIFATGDAYRVLRDAPNAIVLHKPFNARALLRAMERALHPIVGIA